MKHSDTWLIVGGDGLIGNRLAVEAKQFTSAVVVSSRRPVLAPHQVFIDLSTDKDFNTAITVRPKVAFLCAAMANLQICHDNPDLSWKINVTGTVRLASELVKQGCFVVFLSSNTVFDGNKTNPQEDYPCSPVSEYGRQKVRTEQELMTLSRNAAGSVAIVRLSKVLASTYGLAAEFVKQLRAGERCFAFDDLRMSPVSLSYVVNALIHVAHAKHSGIFHLSGAEELTYADFAKRLAFFIGVDPNLVRPLSSTETGIKLLFTPNHPALGMKRTKDLLGISPEPTSHMLEQIAVRNSEYING